MALTEQEKETIKAICDDTGHPSVGESFIRGSGADRASKLIIGCFEAGRAAGIASCADTRPGINDKIKPDLMNLPVSKW